ncbi:hypothetical protein GCM10020255_059570 [Rhodococcus baikonurensis]
MLPRGYRLLRAPPHPSNDIDRRERLAAARLYLCTDARREGDLAQFAEAALSGGVDIIQLRDKGSAGEREFGPLEAKDELVALGILAAAARRHGALLAVNDRADLAMASGADILHLGQNDIPVPYARTVVGEDVVIGRSTSSRAQASLAAIEEGVDYFCTGPVWATPTKPNRSASGLELVRSTADAAPPRPGSRSAVSTRSACQSCSTPVPHASSSCVQSPTRRIPRRPRNASPQPSPDAENR